MTAAELQHIADALKTSIVSGIKDALGDETKKVFDSSGNELHLTGNRAERDAYFQAEYEQLQADKIAKLDRAIAAVQSGNSANTRAGQDKIKEYKEEQERIRNGGISKKDAKDYEKKYNKAKFDAAVGVIRKIQDIAFQVIDLVFAFKRFNLEGQKNFFEYSQKLIEADAQYRNKQISAMTTTLNAFTTQIATDAAFASNKTLGGEALSNFTKSVTGE